MWRAGAVVLVMAAAYLLCAWVFGLPPLTPRPTTYGEDGLRPFHCDTSNRDFIMLVEFSQEGGIATVEMDQHRSGPLSYRGASWFRGDTYSDGIVTLTLDGEAHINGFGVDADCHG